LVLYNKQGEVVAVYPYGSEEQSRFERTKILDDAVEQGIEKIEQLKQSILKKAFEGKLVEPDSNDEPVEFVLERIKKKSVCADSRKRC
jgi:type I restriction enzyme S subunit